MTDMSTIDSLPCNMGILHQPSEAERTTRTSRVLRNAINVGAATRFNLGIMESVVSAISDEVRFQNICANDVFERPDTTDEQCQACAVSPQAGSIASSSSSSPRDRESRDGSVFKPQKNRYHWHKSRAPGTVRTLVCRSFFPEWTAHEVFPAGDCKNNNMRAHARLIDSA